MALKALSKDEDLALVPGDQPVLVQLPEFEDGAEAQQDENEGSKTLKEQLDALKAANEISLKRERDQRIEAEGRAAKAEHDRAAALASQAETESTAVTSGLAAAQAEQSSAKQALKTAGESGDWDAIGEAQARIARAASDIREYERAAASLADERARPAQQPRPIDIHTAIDGNAHLLDAEKVWFKAHPEAMMDPSRNKEVDVAYMKAMRKGIPRGTPEYFKFIETEMGYLTPEKEEGAMSVSAPGTRNDRGSDGRLTNGRIPLSPEERDFAKNIQVSELDYARQKLKLDEARRADPEKYR